MPDVMVDIETLGISPESVILSIAAVRFEPFEVTKDLGSLEAIQILIDVDTQVDNYKRMIDDSTVEWWTKQDAAVKEVIFSESGRVDLPEALKQLSKFCWNKMGRLWAQGPSFDCVLLEHAYRQTGVPRPWQYYQVRDSRTLLDLVEVKQESVTHDSIEDCRRQISGVQQALNKLNVTKFIR